MQQDERSERSRTAILDAALELFSHRGYGATSMRDIARKAGVSTGSVYHHFAEKEVLFQTLLEQFKAITQRPDFPINVALEQAADFYDFERLAAAAHDVLERWPSHLSLFYVDAVEFEGRHIQRFYADLTTRFEQFAAANAERLHMDTRMRTGLPTAAALLFATRSFIYYYSVERIFGVQRQFGLESADAVRMISRVLRHGMLDTSEAAPPAPPVPPAE